jgi:hypothetical protein
MDAARAISLVVEEIRSGGLDYPRADLTAAQFLGGWCVYSPEIIADGDQAADLDEEVTRSVFLVGESSGRVRQIESSEPAADARDWFQEACIWFSAEEPGITETLSTSRLPSTPDLRGSSQPRQPRQATAYDRQALDALAKALIHEPDFPGWVAGRLGELADLLGGSSRLVARRRRSQEATHVAQLARPQDVDDPEHEGPTGVWRTWPAVDPESLPDADTTRWLLIPCVAAGEYVEDLESETDAATRVADIIADRARDAPSWRACGVAELMPQLVALRRNDQLDADLDTLRRLLADYQAEGVLDKLLIAPSPGDADAEALLRIAVDADQHHREIIDIDAAATAAYRRVLDRLGLFFENYAFEAMSE